MKIIKGGITAPKGFKASGIHSGIKKIRKDLMLIVSDVPAVAAGTFTSNQVKAAPVILDIERIKSGKGQAIIANSGNANACTGKPGMVNAKKMAAATAKALKIKPELVYVSSTGVIGKPLPVEKIEKALPLAVKELSIDGAADAAQAIMTTDRIPKEVAVEFSLGGSVCRIAGITKGAGMIGPAMTGPHATMLCYITTDVVIAPKLLQSLLETCVDRSFNHVTVDNDQSTNDTVIALANGLAGNKLIAKKSGNDYRSFEEALQCVCTHLAKLIAKDGEGATKLVEVIVEGAKTKAAAFTAAKSVANSPLVKTAIFGTDANWGRILCAVGYCGVKIDPEKVDITIGGRHDGDDDYHSLQLVKKGMGSGYDETAAKKILNYEEIQIVIDLHQGEASSYMWTCDFSLDYVKINASYRS
jgi:glutamate N-acetyltransferase / amino-acid N-acetyltransferase